MRDELDFDPDAPEKETRARHIPWRPIGFFGGLALLVAGAWAFDANIVNVWWPSWLQGRDQEIDRVGGVWNVAGVTDWSPIPPPKPEPQVVQVDRPVGVPYPQIRTELMPAPPHPAPPPPAPPPPAFRVVTSREPSGLIAYVPQHERPPLSLVDGRIPGAHQGCVLQPGLSEIHATLRDEVRWDMGGQIEAIVTRPVLSPERHDWTLIPAGASLVGYANAENLQRGMDLAPAPRWATVAWVDSATGERIVRRLYDAGGANVSGVNGIGGEVDARWGPIFGLMAIATVTDFISSISVSFGDSETVNARVSGSSAGRIAESVAEQMLDIKPRITTAGGTQIVIKPSIPIRMC